MTASSPARLMPASPPEPCPAGARGRQRPQPQHSPASPIIPTAAPHLSMVVVDRCALDQSVVFGGVVDGVVVVVVAVAVAVAAVAVAVVVVWAPLRCWRPRPLCSACQAAWPTSTQALKRAVSNDGGVRLLDDAKEARKQASPSLSTRWLQTATSTLALQAPT